MVVAALLGALGFVLMFLDFSVPVMPGFIKFDFSDLPALLGAFALGPVWGVVCCLVKNVLHLMITDTAGVGTLSNFLLGSIFVFTAGFIYQKSKSRKGALLGAAAGAVVAGLIGVITNYFIVYPVYFRIMAPEPAVLGAYQALNPNVNSLWDALIWFNLPFTVVKFLVVTVVVTLVYKKLSPILKGNK